MSYFQYTRAQLEELIDAYEAYCDEIGVMYYNQHEEDIQATWLKVKEIREELGVPVD